MLKTYAGRAVCRNRSVATLGPPDLSAALDFGSTVTKILESSPIPRCAYCTNCNYGTAAKDVYTEAFMAGACPIVGSYGAKDRANRGTGQRLEQILTALGVEHDIKTYPDAGHSFLNDHDPADIPTLLAVLGRFTGPDYHEPSARDARERIIAFFDVCT